MLNKFKKLFSTAWKEIKKLFSDNFYIIKNGIFSFVCATFNWLYNIIKGFVKILIKMIVAISKLLLKGMTILYTKLCLWISKW